MLDVLEPAPREENGDLADHCVCGAWTEFGPVELKSGVWQETTSKPSYWGCRNCGRVTGFEGVVAAPGTWEAVEN